MNKLLGAFALVPFLSACVSYAGGNAMVETSAICDTSGLETQYKNMKVQSNRSRGVLTERDRDDVEVETQSIQRRLNDYDAEIDAQYRSVTNSCKAYSRCMEMNEYKEARCRSSLARWESSEREFTNLSRDLREIEAQIENLRTVSSRPGRYRPRVNSCENGELCY